MILSANLYVWTLSSDDASIMATLAITPTEQAVALTQAGLWQEASAAFGLPEVLWKNHLALRALKQITDKEARRDVDEVSRSLKLADQAESSPAPVTREADIYLSQSTTNILETFGIDSELLKTAPAITVNPEQWRIDESPRSDEPGYKNSVPIFLTPGVYTIQGGDDNISVYQAGTEISLGNNPIRVPFGVAAIELRIPKTEEIPASIKIKPLPEATLDYYQKKTSVE